MSRLGGGGGDKFVRKEKGLCTFRHPNDLSKDLVSVILINIKIFTTPVKFLKQWSGPQVRTQIRKKKKSISKLS